jgi:hypothetical protein
MNPEQIEALKSLSALKDDGTLTEEEFAAEKKKILEVPPPATKPARRKIVADVLGGISAATSSGDQAWVVDRLKQPLAICSIVLFVTLFLPWLGLGPIAFSAWVLGDVNAAFLLLYLIPIGVGYVLFRLGKGLPVDARLRVLLGLIPSISLCLALFGFKGGIGQLLEVMSVGCWLAIVVGIVVALDARVPERFRSS